MSVKDLDVYAILRIKDGRSLFINLPVNVENAGVDSALIG